MNLIQDAKMDILIGDRIDLMMLDCYSEIKNNTQAMEAIAELVAKLPGIEIEGELPKHEAFAKFKEKNSCTNGEKGLDKPSLKGELKKKSQMAGQETRQNKNRKDKQQEM